MIPDEDVARVRAATDLVALIGEHVALRQQGRRWVGLCPFHSEKTPSFSVNAADGLYYCFGCQASGDAITFVRAVDHLDFAEAVGFLADRAGIEIRDDPQDAADRRQRAQLYQAMEAAVAWYHERLLGAPDAGPARDYLRSRGYDKDVVRQFRLGWAPDDWDALCRALRLPERVITDAGLGFVNRRGRLQDAFRARVLFPICDPSGRPIALGGRILPPRAAQAPPSTEPKYKNSQETAIYTKRRTLYALNWAKKDIVARNEVVVCEGYTDVIGCFQSGVPRAVATCGTALAEEHFSTLRNFAKRIVLAYDADNAGQSAISRVYEWERRHDVDVAVAALPEGADPGSLAKEDPGALVAAVEGARPFLAFRVERAIGAADLTTAEGRAKAAEAAVAVIAEHPDDLVRDQYVMTVADRCRIEPDRLRARLAEARAALASSAARGPKPSASASDAVPSRGGRSQALADVGPEAPPSQRASISTNAHDPSARAGVEALRLAVHRPDEMSDRLEAVLFADPVQREAFEALASTENLHEAIAVVSPPAADLLHRVSVEEPVAPDVELGDPVDGAVAQLLRIGARRAFGELQAEARAGRGDPLETGRIRLWIEQLDDPEAGREAADRLLAWLVGRDGERG
jgi:DNA primase